MLPRCKGGVSGGKAQDLPPRRNTGGGISVTTYKNAQHFGDTLAIHAAKPQYC